MQITSPKYLSLVQLRKGLMESLGIMHNGIKVLADACYGNRETVVGTSRTAGGKGLIEFIFISSHGFKLYAQCLRFLRKYGYRIICEHTPAESFAVDGLI